MRLFTTFIALSILLTACGSGERGSSAVAGSDSTAQSASSDEEQHDFRLFLSGALQDTLQGSAAFGKVLNSKTGNSHFVIEMTIEDAPASGVYVTRSDTTRPEAGAYDVVGLSDSSDTSKGEQLALIWRSGMRRRLTATGGTITLDTATDTLITGSVEGALQGTIVKEGGVEETKTGKQTVQIDGQFRAENGSVGYIGF